MPNSPPWLLRGLSAAAGVALVVATVAATPFIAFFLLLSAQVPNAYEQPGDPCCGVSRTWGEVAGGVGFTTVFLVGFGLLIAAAAAALAWGVRGRMLRRRTVLLGIPGSIVGAGLLVIAITLFTQRGDVHLVTDCGSFRFRANEWRAGDAPTWQRTARGLSDCPVLEGQTPEQVRAALGMPGDHHTFPASPSHREIKKWGYRDALYVEFRGGRVTSVDSDLFVD